MTRGRATAIGFSAVLMWSLLAVLTIGSAPVPPLLLNALCFGIGGGLGLVWGLATGSLSQVRRVSLGAYAAGTLGLFGYHALYFTAFRLAPTAETGLIAYLWPLFIVLLSGLLPGERLRRAQIAGALVAFAGAALIVLRGAAPGTGIAPADLTLGLGLAFLCALTWAGYSVLSRRFSAVPTAAVTVYCLATAALSALAHLTFETTTWPAEASGWIAIALLGLGPVGAAFFTWDVGMKKGDIQMLGVASYSAPLLSTLALILAGRAAMGWQLVAAAVLIAAGAALAARRPVRRGSDARSLP